MQKNTHGVIGKLRRLITRDDGALGFIQIAAIAAGAILAGSIAFGAITAVRLGGDLTGVFERDAQMNTMAQRMQDQLSGATEITAVNAQKFVVKDQPSRRSAFYTPGAKMPTVCVTNEWTLVPAGDTRTLTNVQKTHATDSCDSAVSKTREIKLTGLDSATAFTYENAYGRDLVYTDGAEQGPEKATNARPEGLFENEWGYASPGFVTIEGEINQAVGTSPVSYSARTPLKQLRPGVVSSDLGELGPPVIERSHVSGDTYRAHMSALTKLSDPRAVIEWSYRQAINGAALSSWSSYSTMDSFDQTVPQGARWVVEARYRVVLEGRNATSEIVKMTWVRPIENPAAPTVAITIGTATDATVTLTPAACAPGTSINTRSRTYVNDGAWSDWKTQTATPWRALFPVAEGAKITASGEARCVTPYAESEWVPSAGEHPSAIRPITSRPTIDKLDSAVTAPADRGIISTEVSACPTGTYYSAQWRFRTNDATSMTLVAFKAIAAAATHNATSVREGERFVGGVTVRCETEHAQGPVVTQDAADWTVNPIRTVPTVTNVVASLTATGVMNLKATLGACPTWTTYDARTLFQRDAETSLSVGTWGASGTAFDRNALTLAQGSRYFGGVEARCETPWAKGPSARGVDTGWNIRPINVPSDPTVRAYINTTTGRVGFGSSEISTVGTCPTGTSYEYGHRRLVRLAATGTWGSWRDEAAIHENIAEGARLDAEGRVRCVSPYTASPWTATIAANVVKPISQPATPTMRVYINTTDEYLGYGSSRVAPAESCATGLTMEYNQRRLARLGATGTWGSWRTQNEIHENIAEGARLDAEGRVRCSSNWADSPWSEVATAYTVKSISKPATPTMRVYINTTADYLGYGSSRVAPAESCNSGLTMDYQQRRMVRTGDTGSWSSWRDENEIHGQIPEGARLDAEGRVRCSSNWTSSPWSDIASGSTVKPISKPATPEMRVYINTTTGLVGYGSSRVAPAESCSTGLTMEFNHRRLQRSGATGTWGSWRDENEIHAQMSEGARLDAEGQVRCVSSWATSSWSNVASGNTVKPITTAPNVTNINGILNSDWSATVAGDVAGCPSGTTYEGRILVRRNSQTTWTTGGWVDVTGPRARVSTSNSYWDQGERFIGGIHVRCISNWTTGPVEGGSEADWEVRPITAKPTITDINVIYTDTSETRWGSRVGADVAGCPSGMTYEARLLAMVNADTDWREGGWNAFSSAGRFRIDSNGTTWREGERMRGGMRARCVTPYADGPIAGLAGPTWDVRPIITVPTLKDVKATLNGEDARYDFTVSKGCPSWLDVQREFADRKNGDDFTFYGRLDTNLRSGDSGFNNSRPTIGQGERWQGAAHLRCRSDYAIGDHEWFNSNWVTRAITSSPTGDAYVSRDGGDTYAGMSSLSSCPSISNARWRFADQENSGAWSAWSSWKSGNGSYYARAIGYGDYMRANFELQCVSPYDSGPVRDYLRTTSTRPYPAPSTPSGLYSSGGSSRSCDNAYWTAGISWNDMAYASYYSVRATWLGPGGTTRSDSFGTTSGTSMRISGAGTQGGTVGLRVYVRAYNGSGSSGEATASIQQAGGCFQN